MSAPFFVDTSFCVISRLPVLVRLIAFRFIACDLFDLSASSSIFILLYEKFSFLSCFQLGNSNFIDHAVERSAPLTRNDLPKLTDAEGRFKDPSNVLERIFHGVRFFFLFFWLRLFR